MQQRINITLPRDLAQELRRNIADRKRSKFITEAIREKLTKSDLKDQLRKSAQAQKEIVEQIQEDFKYVDAEAFEKIP